MIALFPVPEAWSIEREPPLEPPPELLPLDPPLPPPDEPLDPPDPEPLELPEPAPLELPEPPPLELPELAPLEPPELPEPPPELPLPLELSPGPGAEGEVPQFEQATANPTADAATTRVGRAPSRMVNNLRAERKTSFPLE
jgi:hypothetical protein